MKGRAGGPGGRPVNLFLAVKQRKRRHDAAMASRMLKGPTKSIRVMAKISMAAASPAGAEKAVAGPLLPAGYIRSGPRSPRLRQSLGHRKLVHSLRLDPCQLGGAGLKEANSAGDLGT